MSRRFSHGAQGKRKRLDDSPSLAQVRSPFTDRCCESELELMGFQARSSSGSLDSAILRSSEPCRFFCSPAATWVSDLAGSEREPAIAQQVQRMICATPNFDRNQKNTSTEGLHGAALPFSAVLYDDVLMCRFRSGNVTIEDETSNL